MLMVPRVCPRPPSTVTLRLFLLEKDEGVLKGMRACSESLAVLVCRVLLLLSLSHLPLWCLLSPSDGLALLSGGFALSNPLLSLTLAVCPCVLRSELLCLREMLSSL